jgi:sarcosine oxidase subunit beta
MCCLAVPEDPQATPLAASSLERFPLSSCDVLVIGAGVVGCSVAFHLARLGAGRVTVLERRQVGAGTTAQSSGILRTHYSVPENVELARRSWRVFEDFAGYVDDPEVSAGLVRCGYLIVAPEGAKVEALQASLAQQAVMGIPVQHLTPQQAAERLPIARFDDAALIGWEPEAGFADAYLVATGFARAARRLGVRIQEGVEVQGLCIEAGRVVGVQTEQGRIDAGVVVSTQNIWAREIEHWTGIGSPVSAERHQVLALDGPQAYTPAMPVFKDLASPGMLYARSYGGRQMLVSEGLPGQALADLDDRQGEVSMDTVAEIGAQVAQRFPSYAEAGLASSWTGIYDVTPDWNPVLGPLPELPGLVVGYGFSGHGFKLSPAVGRVLAQAALGLPTDVSLAPYALERFRAGKWLVGRYGQGAVS